ncbi:hypothetical protein EVAR_79754_1 [Eumeta japonica]|uniref:Uncharacterized protein n=1 Tax=Eumeta variegata TaxID=151549 RepID=A0A4C1T9H4_EUMVA|nr:hypothetical protein EVAR_79754_1 [Eumeta japonica]
MGGVPLKDRRRDSDVRESNTPPIVSAMNEKREIVERNVPSKKLQCAAPRENVLERDRSSGATVGVKERHDQSFISAHPQRPPGFPRAKRLNLDESYFI